jgi:hypothetical protein
VLTASGTGRNPSGGTFQPTFFGHLSRVATFLRPRRSPHAIDRQPVGTGNAQIRWSIDPNSRRVRWLSASISQ